MTCRTLIACAALALTAACSGDSEMPSAEQDREMNEAADLLEKAPDSLANVDDSALLSEQAANSSGNQQADP